MHEPMQQRTLDPGRPKQKLPEQEPREPRVQEPLGQEPPEPPEREPRVQEPPGQEPQGPPEREPQVRGLPEQVPQGQELPGQALQVWGLSGLRNGQYHS